MRRQRPQVASGWRYPASRPQAPRRLVTLAQPPQFERLLTRYLDGSEVVAVDRPEELAGAVRQAQADAVVLPAGSLDQEALEELARECRPQLVPVVAFRPLEEHCLGRGLHCLMRPSATRVAGVAGGGLDAGGCWWWTIIGWCGWWSGT